MGDLGITVSEALRRELRRDGECCVDETSAVPLSTAARALASLDDATAMRVLRGCRILSMQPPPSASPELEAARAEAEQRAYLRMVPGADEHAARTAEARQWAHDRRGIARLANIVVSVLGVAAAVWVACSRMAGLPVPVSALAAIASALLVFLAELYFAVRDGVV